MSKNTGTSELINYFDLGANGDVGIAGSLDVNTIANATTDTDRFLVSDTGIIKYRTGAELLSDIGAAPATGGSYLPLAGGTMTGNVDWAQTDRGLNWLFNTDGAYIKFYNTGDGDTDSRLEFATLDNNNEYFRWGHLPSGGSFYESMRLRPVSSGNAELIVTGKIIKSGGTSSQYLMADGSVSTLTNPVTGTGTTNYLPKFTGASAIGNSQVFDDGTNVGINNASPIYILDAYSTGTGTARIRIQGTTNFAVTQAQNSSGILYMGIDSSTAGGFGFGNYSRLILSTNNYPLVFGVNSAESMRIWGATGNVNIGTTPASDAGYKLDVNGTGRFSGNVVLGTTALTGGGAAQWLTANGTPYGGGFITSVSGVAKGYYYYDNAANAAVVQGAAGVGIQLLANNAAALTISTTGAATFSSPSSIIANNQGIRVYSTDSQAADLGGGISFGGNYIGTSVNADFANIKSGKDNSTSGNYAGYLSFSTNAQATGNVERMRITSSGRLVVGTQGFGNFDHAFLNVSNQGTAAFAQFSGAGNPPLGAWNNADSGDNLFMRFFQGGGGSTAGSIDYNRAAGLVRYNATSDKNLKNIIGDSDGKKSIEILNSTRIREYSWKEDETNKPQIGVIAQELYETYKGAVSVGSDEELLGTEEYNPWGVDKTAFTFHLIAGWQEHEKQIKELQEQIDKLKNA